LNKLKLPEISTIIILNKNDNRTQSLQIKTKHINRLRHYVVCIVLFISALLTVTFYLRHQNQKQYAENQQLVSQLVKLKGSLPVAGAAKPVSAQSYIQAIQLKLQKINDYLRKRGLKGFSNKSVGGNGNVEGAKLSDKDAYMYYDEYLEHLVADVGHTPMGYPRTQGFSSSFGYRADPFNTANAEFHPGIDFKGSRGDTVKCTANGTVESAGWYGGYGNCVRVLHGNNLETLYGHLSRIVVKVGQKVVVGQKVGEVGSTGHSTGTHLHYEVRKNGRPVNPVSYLALGK
jgi:murein DD-endopeptidase MepM/ murein hydrolase activator NlpD